MTVGLKKQRQVVPLPFLRVHRFAAIEIRERLFVVGQFAVNFAAGEIISRDVWVESDDPIQIGKRFLGLTQTHPR